MIKTIPIILSLLLAGCGTKGLLPNASDIRTTEVSPFAGAGCGRTDTAYPPAHFTNQVACGQSVGVRLRITW